MNNGCIIVLMKSVRMIREELESVKETMDKRVYEKSMDELSAMQSFMQGILDERNNLSSRSGRA